MGRREICGRFEGLGRWETDCGSFEGWWENKFSGKIILYRVDIMKVRFASEEDFENLFNLYKQLYILEARLDNNLKDFEEVEENLRKYVQRCLKKENYIVLIAEKDSKILGFIIIAIREYTKVCKKQKFGYIDAIFVKEDSRKKGIGRKLLNEAEKFLKEQKIHSLELDIYEGNKEAIKFYQKSGFRIISKRMRKEI
jgi:ribosomal protein S18 acetylase RimI-like enzyme